MRLVAAGLVVVAVSGCALLGKSKTERAASTEPLLAAAGFQAVPARTPEQQKSLDTLTPLRLTYSTRGGKPHYWYADPYRCKCLYTGSSAQYEQYEALLVKKQVAQEERATALSEEDAASIDKEMDWWLPDGDVMWATDIPPTPELIEP